MVQGKVAFIADLHVKPLLWAHRSPVTGDAAYALAQCTDMILEEGVSDVFYLGDLTDSPEVDGETGRLIRDMTHRLDRAGVRQYAIQGNHDRGDTPVCRMFGIEHLDERTVECAGISIHGLDYRHAEAAKAALANVPECSILLMHAPFRHLLGFDGKWQFEAADVPDHVGGVIVGDVHKYNRLKLHKSGAGMSREIISPGSIYPVKADEAEVEHGFMVFNGMGMEYRRLKHRAILKYSNALESLEAFLEEVSQTSAGDVLRPVVLAPECPAVLKDRFKDVIIVETGYAAAFEEEVKGAVRAYTLLEALEERFSKGGLDVKVKTAAERLIGCQSPVKELEAILQEEKVELQLK